MRKYEYYIGIDTGVVTGYAEWHKPSRTLLRVESTMIHRAMERVKHLKDSGFDLFVRLEDARLRKWIPRMETDSRERGRREGAGSVKRDASVWEDYLTDLGIPFELVAPRYNKTKVTHDYFVRLTRWNKPTNEHGRDAATLVFGL